MRPLRKTLRALGIIEPDKRKTWTFVARTDGYVQQLFVASPGEIVEKDAPLLSLYSPDLLTAQRELLMLRQQSGKSADLIEAARTRLLQWNVSAAQIAQLERDGKPSEILTLESPFRGVVENVFATQGAAVKVGDSLVSVADLSVVWLWAEVYETELAFLKLGQKVDVTTSAHPDTPVEGTISLVDPFVDPIKRTVRARVDVPNLDFALRPGMYADATFTLDAGMGLAIPVDTVMPTGSRNLVFVDLGNGKLQPRSISLAGKFGEFYAVKSGLSAGDRVVASANFLIDAESKVQGALKDFSDDESETKPAIDSAILSRIVESYLALHTALANDKLDDAQSFVKQLRNEASALPSDNVLRQSIEGIQPSSMEETRNGFGRLSAALLETLKNSPVPRRLYVMRCPMWNSSPGEWVQVSKEVENPFMGQAMATCGEVICTLGK
jgi:Cu(I)/Ag(I) efflux system membrane fusion protein